LKLQRIVAGLVGCSALALGVAACGNDTDSGSANNASAAGSAQKGGTINGAGATFPQPIYSEWAARFKDAQGTTVNYQAIGSGGGIAQFTAGTVDFGATDSAMKDDEIKAAEKKGAPVHIPTVLGAVTVSYNVNGLDKGLKLDAATIADIFLGKAGAFVQPSLEATSAAAEGVTPPANLRFSTIDAPGDTAYPISAITFLLVYQDGCKAGMTKEQAGLVKDWLNYGAGAGQAVAPDLEYAALPDTIKQKAQAKVDGLQCNGAAIAAG
jgi:ABC-type phosphate transport system substrate-binding protein